MALRRAVAAVLFDLDGTLLDTEPLSDRAIEHVIGPLGARVRRPARGRSPTR